MNRRSGAPGRAVLVYDASCPICRKVMERVRESSDEDAFEFLPCGSEGALGRYPGIRTSDCLRAVHLVLPDGRVLSGAEAAPEIFARIPRYRRAATFLRLPGTRPLAALLYRVFARNRHWIGHLLFPDASRRKSVK